MAGDVKSTGPNPYRTIVVLGSCLQAQAEQRAIADSVGQLEGAEVEGGLRLFSKSAGRVFGVLPEDAGRDKLVASANPGDLNVVVVEVDVPLDEAAVRTVGSHRGDRLRVEVLFQRRALEVDKTGAVDAYECPVC